MLPVGKFTSPVNTFQITKTEAIGSHQFLFLLAWVAAFLLIAVFILDFSTRGFRLISNTPPVNFEEVSYPSSLWKNRINRTLEAASREKDQSKKFELYSQIFGELLAIYDIDHDPKTRKQAEDMGQFIEWQFPEKYQTGNFAILCLDLDCGQPNYSEEVLNLKEKIQSIKSIDPFVLEAISKKFDAAAFYNDPSLQWENYLAIFNSLVSEKRRTNDGEISKIAQDFRDFLNKNYTENYSQIEGLIPGVFDI